MRKIIAIAIVALIVIGGVIALYAIKGNPYNSPSPSPSPTSTMDMSSSPSPSGSLNPEVTSSVTIDNFAFSPAAITVKKGTTVTWTNKDAAVHTVTETDGQSGPKSGNLNNGESYSFTFDTVGTFKYNCSIHPSMTGSVTVTE